MSSTPDLSLRVLLNYASSISVVLPFIAVFYSGSGKLIRNSFFMLIVLSFFVELISSVLSYFKLNNIWLYYLFTPVEFSLILFSLNNLLKEKLNTTTVAAFVVMIFAFTMVDFLFINGIQHFNSFTRSMELLLLISISLYGFFNLMRNPPSFFLQRSPLFWLSFSVLLYSAGNLFLFASHNILLEVQKQQSQNYWILHSILNIVFNLLLAKTVLCMKAEQKFR